jgi:hypothetical protein
MRFHKLLFAHHGASIYGLLVLGSGVVLMLSMPWAVRLSELILQPWRPIPLPFYLMHLALSSLTALAIGASAAPASPELQQFPALPAILVRVAFGQFLVLPLVAYSRVLFPASAAPLIGAAAYTLLTAILVAMIAARIESMCAYRGKSSMSFRYIFLLIYMAVPILGQAFHSPIAQAFALISPVQALWRMIAGSLATYEWLVAFSVPAAALLWAALSSPKGSQGGTHRV